MNFCKKLKLINDLYKTNDSLIDQMFELRTYYEDINNKISDFIIWQDNTKGMKANLPRIQDSYKDLLFRYWYIRLTKVEEAIYKARDLAGQVTKTVRESLAVTQENACQILKHS